MHDAHDDVTRKEYQMPTAEMRNVATGTLPNGRRTLMRSLSGGGCEDDPPVPVVELGCDEQW